MNYLAHAYLSFNDEEILVGNIISDHVKGKKKFDYSPGIQKGIGLHRMIDEFTDYHPVTNEAKKIFKSAAGLYSGAFMDVVYDHFLALDSNIFFYTSLKEFTGKTYHTLEKHLPVLPEKFASMFPFMKEHDWLLNYQYTWGIERSFAGLARRAKYLEDSSKAYEAFIDNYDVLKKYAYAFLPEVKKYAHVKFIENI